MSFLNDRQRQTLARVCEALVPRLAAEQSDDEALFAASAEGSSLAEEFEAAIQEIAGEEGETKLQRVLGLLESRLANSLIAGRFRPLSQGTPEQSAEILSAWGNSRLAAARTAFIALKRLALFLHYSGSSDSGTNPTWQGCGYAPPPALVQSCAQAERPLRMLDISQQAELSADVLVIGSGAGGGVVAAEFAAAGHDVLVVEKGDYYHGAEFAPSERLGMSRLYEKRGSLATTDLGLVVLAGSTLGGGTAVNWMTCLEPPDYVREEWAREYAFRGALSAEFQESLDAVSRRLGVTTAEGHANRQNAILEEGCRALGFRVEPIPRNATGCGECGFCCFGCRSGAKQDTRQTFLLDAQTHGARILPGAQAERVLHSAGRVTGAELQVRDAQRNVRQITVRAKSVVAAAGAIHTPALLMRSGLTNANLGRHLHLHPTTATYARFAEPVLSWQGVPQSRYSDELANLDSLGYGVRFEAAPAHPGLWALALGWQTPRDHKRRMQSLAHLANTIVLTRDRFSGQVKLDKSGGPQLHYKLHSYDAAHMMQGTLAALRLQRAAGGLEVCSPHYDTLIFRGGSDAQFERFLSQVSARGFVANRYGLFSAHQLSSCRLAGSPKQGVVNPAGETYEIKNLYVADGSLLPSACGVNPMLTIMGMAHYLAKNMGA